MSAEEIEKLLKSGAAKRLGIGSRRTCYALPGGRLCVKCYRSDAEIAEGKHPGRLPFKPIAPAVAQEISRFRFKGREKIFTLFTAGILVPLNALMVPYFVIINRLGLYNTYGGMILLYCAIGIPMSTFLIRGLMDSIPMELEEAAYIDGCGFFGRFTHIILPLSRTGIVTAATFEFLTCWNEFVFANLIVSSEKLRTIQVGIRYFTNQFSTDYVSMYAAIMISIIPSIIGYVLFQEQIISGMTSGAVKG